MTADRLSELRTFIAIVERGSLTAAARHLGRSLQSVSRSLAALERDIGVELVRRTTRQSNPTDAGRSLHRRLTAALAEIEEAKREAAKGRAEPAGLLRVTASTTFAPLYLVPVVAGFLELYPQVEIELDVSDRYVDLVGEGFDVAVRVGEMRDSRMKARRVAQLRRVAFAAPSYLAKHGRPRHPNDLSAHECIVRTAALDANVWPFLVNGRRRTVKVNGRFRTSGTPAANEAAARGLGIANAPFLQVRGMVERGELELVLTRFEPPRIPVHAVWPATKALPLRTQLLIEFLAKRLKHEVI